MTSAEIVGAMFALVTLIGGCIVRDRQISKAREDGDSKLHERINKVEKRISDTREEYVTKEDLQQYFNQVQNSIDRLSKEVKGTNDRIDTLFLQGQECKNKGK